MAVKIITAYTKKDRVIGKEGQLPWHISDDMKHFKVTTGTDPVVMGRTTFESLPANAKPLPNRLNIVISTTVKGCDLFYDPAEPMYAKSLERAFELCDLTVPGHDIWIIGGGQLYKYALENDLVDEVIASEIKKDYEGDVHFPKLGKGWSGPEPVKSYDEFDVVKYVRK